MCEAPYPLDGASGAQVVPVSEALGGEIRGIDPGRDMGDATFEAIHQAWLRHLVLLFREHDRFTWHHQWRVGDLLIWDNRCTMHRRDGFDAQSQRIMHRTRITDDQPPSRGEIP